MAKTRSSRWQCRLSVGLAGISLGYITDTTCRPDSTYWDLISEVDYLVHECNFTDKETEFAELTGHSWASAVLAQAKKQRIKNLILTHLNPLRVVKIRSSLAMKCLC